MRITIQDVSDALRDGIADLNAANDHAEEIMQQLDSARDALAAVTVERDNARNAIREFIERAGQEEIPASLVKYLIALANAAYSKSELDFRAMLHNLTK